MRYGGIDLSVESIPDLQEREEVVSAHNLYHGRSETGHMTVDIATEIANLLSRSPDLDHQLDSGWIYASIAISFSGKEREVNIDLAERAWLAVAELAENPADRIKALLNLAYLPAFEEKTRTGNIRFSDLFERILRVNRAVLETATSSSLTTPERQHRGAALEVLIAGLLVRHGCRTGHTSILAWPTPSWQDRGHNRRGGKNKNFDIAYGPFPTIRHRIQSKSALGQEDLVERLGTDDPQKLYEFWRDKYASNIALVFGDFFCGPHKDGYYGNRLLSAGPSPETDVILDSMTEYIFGEIAKAQANLAQNNAL